MKKITKLFAVLFVQALLCQNAVANDDERVNIVAKIYENYQNDGVFSWDENTDIFADELLALFEEDGKSADTGDIGCIDSDIFINAQDFDAKAIKDSLKLSLEGDEVVAKFSLFDKASATEVHYVFECKNECKIADVITKDKNFGDRSLKQFLKQCLAK
ncbi:MAG: hypothetical protein K5978_02175 [Campylobacter sp.]|nr:hypothetical protein [Campylobacter sp.]